MFLLEASNRVDGLKIWGNPMLNSEPAGLLMSQQFFNCTRSASS